MELVTGHGASEHITAAQVSRLIQGVTVMDDTTVYRLNVGNDCAIGVNGLTVGISTGEMVLHGYHTTFEDAETLTLDPTLDAAKSRIDKICLIISEDLTTGIQSAYIQVVQGTEATTPTTPATPSTPTSPTELYMGVGVIATVTVSDTVIASYVDNTDLYAGSFVTKAEFDTNIANIAPIEATSTASKAYSVGSQLIYNGLLYKVDSAIAQGATLTPGGNISLSPTVEAQIASVKSSLTWEKINNSAISVTALNTDKTESFSYTKAEIHEILIKTESGDTVFGVQNGITGNGSANVSKTINATNYKGTMFIDINVDFNNKSISVTLNLKEMGAMDNATNRGKMTVIAVR